MSTQLGAQMYTVRDFTKTTEDLQRTLRKIKEIGYDAVQVSGIGADIPVPVVADLLRENELVCAATHIGFAEMQNDLDAVIEKHKAWGCTYVGVGAMPESYRGSAEGFAKFAREATAIAENLRKAGLIFVYHNHQFEFRKFGGKLGMDILFEESGDAFQFELDTFWVQKGGADILHWIDKVRGRMDVVHFKDMAIDASAEQIMAEIGQGNLNWDAILTSCKDTHVKWHLVEQDVCQVDPFESLKISYAFLTGKGLK